MELTDKVLIDNLCAWPLYFKRLNGIGDITIPANVKGFSALDVAEVQMQIQSGNPMFVGEDVSGQGNHARLYIVDDSQRKELFGQEPDGEDNAVVLTEQAVKDLLAVRNKETFHKKLDELVKTDAEKMMVVQVAKAAGGDEVAAWKMDAINAIAETSNL